MCGWKSRKSQMQAQPRSGTCDGLQVPALLFHSPVAGARTYQSLGVLSGAGVFTAAAHAGAMCRALLSRMWLPWMLLGSAANACRCEGERGVRDAVTRGVQLKMGSCAQWHQRCGSRPAARGAAWRWPLQPRRRCCPPWSPGRPNRQQAATSSQGTWPLRMLR